MLIFCKREHDSAPNATVNVWRKGEETRLYSPYKFVLKSSGCDGWVCVARLTRRTSTCMWARLPVTWSSSTLQWWSCEELCRQWRSASTWASQRSASSSRESLSSELATDSCVCATRFSTAPSMCRECDNYNLNNMSGIALSEYVGHVTIIQLNVHYCVLFSSRVRVRIKVRIRFSFWLVSCYAHVIVLGLL